MITINGYEVAGRMPPFTRENRDLVRSGVKTQTRRVMKPQPEWPFYGPEVYTSCAVDRFGDMIPGKEVFGIYGDDWGLKCPYGRPGDIRVMCEPLHRCLTKNICYENPLGEIIDGRKAVWQWKRDTLSSMFMPTWAGRTLVRYIDIRAERLQDISEEDAIAEGILPYRHGYKTFFDGAEQLCPDAKFLFWGLWDSINYKKHPWANNDLVWVIEWELL